MNKNILLIAVIAVMLICAGLLILGIIRNSGVPNEEAKTIEPKAVVAPGESEQDYLSTAVESEKKGDLVKAKDAYQKLTEKYPASGNAAKVQESLDNLNIKILFSSVITPDSMLYEVQPGDTLNKIAKKFNTTSELIMKANNLKDAAVRSGKKLKVTKAKFSIAVDKSQNILTLKNDQEIVKTYRVSTGKNSCTPVGTFKITNKLIDPPWYPSAGGMIPAKDPKNVLGSRWLGISKQGYGIHGTIEPESIGKSVTEGCVRMKNSEVEELYSIVPIGTEIVIID
ncbi:MAG: L,D-transpeptidase family protein [Candidatus Omnitrophica bacterium]|nr:L,D-transpeptidase family protein [Candidatus Omnitrophota bacterium]